MDDPCDMTSPNAPTRHLLDNSERFHAVEAGRKPAFDAGSDVLVSGCSCKEFPLFPPRRFFVVLLVPGSVLERVADGFRH
jgi:hypothetical protein